MEVPCSKRVSQSCMRATSWESKPASSGMARLSIASKATPRLVNSVLHCGFLYVNLDSDLTPISPECPATQSIQ